MIVVFLGSKQYSSFKLNIVITLQALSNDLDRLGSMDGQE